MERFPLIAGLRVVRGPDWCWGSQDGGQGCVGTVVKEEENTDAVVQWDCGDLYKYRCGRDLKYDLRVLDSGPASLFFPGVRCFGCYKEGISGFQWRCISCPDYQLCGRCYMDDCHSLHHTFFCVIAKSGKGVRVTSRFDQQRQVARGLYPGATVKRGPDWRWKNQDGGLGSCGCVLDVKDWKESFRSVVQVEWKTARKNSYRAGYKGKVDVQCQSVGEGPPFYLDHLPLLGGELFVAGPKDFFPGDLVHCEPDIEALKATVGSDADLSELVSLMLEGLGTVTRELILSENFSVRLSNNTLHSMTTSAMTKTNFPDYHEGDVVRMMDEMSEVYKLQKGHGEWKDDMALSLGQVGVVQKTKKDGDIIVQFSNHFWWLNPLCVIASPEESPPKVEESAATTTNTTSGLLNALLGLDLDDSIALHAAIQAGDVQKTRWHLETHPDQVEVSTNDGKTPLVLAVEESHTKIVEVLIKEFKANVEAMDPKSERRPIHIVALTDSVDILKLLIGAGADVNARGPNNATPLMVAGALNNNKVLKILATNPDINFTAEDAYDSCALQYCNRAHRTIGMMILVDHFPGPLPSSTKTMIHDAGYHDNLPGLEILARKYPDKLNMKMTVGGDHAPMHIAAIRNSYFAVEFFCRHPLCDLDLRGEDLRTILHNAVIAGNTEITELVVGYGADMNAYDDRTNNALHMVLSKKIARPPHKVLNPQITKVKAELVAVLGSSVPDYLTVSCFLAQEGTSAFLRSDLFNLIPLQLCPPQYLDVFRNFINKSGEFCGTLKYRHQQKGRNSTSNGKNSLIYSLEPDAHLSRIKRRTTLPPPSHLAPTIQALKARATQSTHTQETTPSERTTPSQSQSSTTVSSLSTNTTNTSSVTDNSHILHDGKSSLSATSLLGVANTLPHELTSSLGVKNTSSLGVKDKGVKNYSSIEINPSTSSLEINGSGLVGMQPLGVKNSSRLGDKNTSQRVKRESSPLGVKLDQHRIGVTSELLQMSKKVKSGKEWQSSRASVDLLTLQRPQPTLAREVELTRSHDNIVTDTQGVSMCIVCEEVCDVKLEPCGHKVLCKECCRRLKRCPACKVTVERIVPAE